MDFARRLIMGLQFLLYWGQRTKGAAHIGDGPVQELGEQFPFLRGEIPDHLIFDAMDVFNDPGVTFQPLGQNVDALAATVVRIGPQFDEAFFLHPVQGA